MASLRFQIHFLIFCASLLILTGCHGYPALPKKHVAFFIFGDSILDVGNNNYINTIGRANYYPYGETFFKYGTGRFSDGRIIPDFIAENAKLPFIQPYLQPGNHNIIDGMNFASAGAGALVETLPGYVLDLNTQLKYFKNVEKQLRQKLGDEGAKKLVSKAVYLFAIGSGDYETNSTIYRTYNATEEYIGIVIGNLTSVVREIHKTGGRKFGFLNLSPLGCLPNLRLPGGGCLEEINVIVKRHNRALSKALKELESQLDGFKYSSHDFYTSVSERINNPSKYGFKEGKIACCGSGPYRGLSSCGGMRGITEYELCENPSDYFFFDSGHGTEKSNQQLAELMWSGTGNVTGPYNLKTLFQHD